MSWGATTSPSEFRTQISGIGRPVDLSSMLNGHHHVDNLPVVMLGHGGGQVEGGRVLNYKSQPNRQMCRLYLSLMNNMGVHLDRFGDADESLSEV